MRASGLLCEWRRRSLRATSPLIAVSLVLARPAFGVPPLLGAVPASAPHEAPAAQPPPAGAGGQAARPPPYPPAATEPTVNPAPASAPSSSYPPMRYSAPAASSRAPGGWQAVYVDLRADNPRVRIDRVIDGEAIPGCAAPCGRVHDRNGVYITPHDKRTDQPTFLRKPKTTIQPDCSNVVGTNLQGNPGGARSLRF